MWKSIYKTLRIVVEEDSQPLPPPDDAALNNFERESGVILPMTYREFVNVFGAGEVGGFFRIMAPDYPSDTDADLSTFNRQIHVDEEEDARIANEPITRIRGMLYFAYVNGGELIAWDTCDVTCKRPFEYGIYLRCLNGQFVKLADSFEQFICEVCLTTGLNPAWKRAGFVVEDEWPIEAVFVPVQQPNP